jgi:small subunit ribosomal protein S20
VTAAISPADLAMARLHPPLVDLFIDIGFRLCYIIGRKEFDMPRRKTSVKQTRKDKKKHLRNLRAKLQLKKTIKKFQSLVAAKNLSEAKALLNKAFSLLDKAAKKNILHRGTSNRRKSRLARQLSKAA